MKERSRNGIFHKQLSCFASAGGAFHTPAARLLQDDAEAAAAASAVPGRRKYVKGEDREIGSSRPRERVRR